MFKSMVERVHISIHFPSLPKKATAVGIFLFIYLFEKNIYYFCCLKKGGYKKLYITLLMEYFSI